MAYVLGYWYADGSLENAEYLRGKYIRVTSTDKETIEKIRTWIGSSHNIVVIKSPPSQNRKTQYFLRIGDHALYDDLIRLGLYPNKSLTIKFPVVPDDFLEDFLRGNLDGDGCVYLALGNGVTQIKIVKRISVIFTSGSFDFLQSLCRILKKRLSLSQDRVYQGTRAFQLRYSTRDSLKIFQFLYGRCPADLFLQRKFDVFRSYYDRRPEAMTGEASLIFRRLGDGHVAK